MTRDDRMNPLHIVGWQCDRCGQLITAIDGGRFEWLASEGDNGDEVLSGLQLVHCEPHQQADRERPCRYDPHKEFGNNKTIVEGFPLERFVGPDGLMVLLSFLAAGELPQAEILEFIKRVQIPGYELARNLRRGEIDSESTPFLGHGYYLQSEIAEMIEWALKG
jgi:hypothetical protein